MRKIHKTRLCFFLGTNDNQLRFVMHTMPDRKTIRVTNVYENWTIFCPDSVSPRSTLQQSGQNEVIRKSSGAKLHRRAASDYNEAHCLILLPVDSLLLYGIGSLFLQDNRRNTRTRRSCGRILSALSVVILHSALSGLFNSTFVKFLMELEIKKVTQLHEH